MIRLKSLILENEEESELAFLAFAKVTLDDVKNAKSYHDLYNLVSSRNPVKRTKRDESGTGEYFFEVGPGGATHMATLFHMETLRDIYFKYHQKGTHD